MRPTYSIIIPHHGSSELLESGLRSIPAREDIEVLVIDDTEGRGAGYARNIGLDRAQGNWLLFMDDDDNFTPEAFPAFDRYADSDYDLIYFYSTSRFTDTGQPADRHTHLSRLLDNYRRQPSEVTEGWLRYNYNEPYAKMIRRSIVVDNAIRFENTRWGNDVHFSTAVGFYARTIAVDTAVVYSINVVYGSLVHQHNLEARRCRYEVILRNNQYLRSLGKPEFQVSVMYSLRRALRYGPKAFIEFIRLGRQYGQDFTIGWNTWLTSAWRTLRHGDYRGRERYISHD